MYKYEMHLHTSACSACASSSVSEMADKAKEAGYSGIVITNHFYHGNTAIDRGLSWEDFVGAYYDDYLVGKKRGEEIGVDVLFGLEDGYGGGKEALIYGLDPLIIINAPEFRDMAIKEMSEFVRANGGFIACAHPFRDRPYIVDPDAKPDMTLFDAVEAFNAGNIQEANEKALRFCEENKLSQISGGDVHNVDSFGSAGLAFFERISSGKQLVSVLRSGDYRLIKNGEIC